NGPENMFAKPRTGQALTADAPGHGLGGAVPAGHGDGALRRFRPGLRVGEPERRLVPGRAAVRARGAGSGTRAWSKPHARSSMSPTAPASTATGSIWTWTSLIRA